VAALARPVLRAFAGGGAAAATVVHDGYAGHVTAGFPTDAGLVAGSQGLADDFRREVLGPRRRVTASTDPQ
jgi:hypothetical protein